MVRRGVQVNSYINLDNAVSNEEVMNYKIYGEKRGLGKFLYKFGQCCVK